MSAKKLPGRKVLQDHRDQGKTLKEIGAIYGASATVVCIALKKNSKGTKHLKAPPPHITKKWLQEGLTPAEIYQRCVELNR